MSEIKPIDETPDKGKVGKKLTELERKTEKVGDVNEIQQNIGKMLASLDKPTQIQILNNLLTQAKKAKKIPPTEKPAGGPGVRGDRESIDPVKKFDKLYDLYSQYETGTPRSIETDYRTMPDADKKRISGFLDRMVADEKQLKAYFIRNINNAAEEGYTSKVLFGEFKKRYGGGEDFVGDKNTNYTRRDQKELNKSNPFLLKFKKSDGRMSMFIGLLLPNGIKSDTRCMTINFALQVEESLGDELIANFKQKPNDTIHIIRGLCAAKNKHGLADLKCQQYEPADVKRKFIEEKT